MEALLLLRLPTFLIADAMDWTEADHMELWEERAAVREFDGEMTRREAEEAAYYDWRNMVGPGVEAPQAMRDAVRKFRQMKWNR